MPQDLSDIQPGELSLVRRGAVKRPFLFMKGDEDEVTVDAATLAAMAKEHGIDTATLAKAMDATGETDDEDDDCEVEKALYTETLDADGNWEPVEKRDFTADDRKRLAASGDAMSDGSYPIENRSDLENAIRAIGRAKNPAEAKAHITARAKALDATSLLPDDWKVSKEDDMSETATAVPVKKEDGSWDLTAVPEDSRPEWEAILAKAEKADEIAKERDTLATRVDEVEKMAKESVDRELTREYVAKAEQLGENEEFGEVLKTIAGAVEQETFEKLEAVLKANHERAKTAGIYEEVGKASTGEGSAAAELDAKAEEIRKSDTSLSKEQALAKAYEQNPDLYARVREEA